MLMLTVMERGTKAVLLFYCLTSGKNCTLTSPGLAPRAHVTNT